MSTTLDRRFDHLGPLPTGTLAIQASAGTGKTYALAALATRFLAEGRISTTELLIVTFTRAATNELRAKVRERLVTAAAHLSTDHPDPTGDEVLDLLARERTPAHLERIERAVTEFDSATVTTIHGFAGLVLSTLGVTAGPDPDARLDVDPTALIAETCADVLIGEAMTGGRVDDLPELGTLIGATRTADGRPDLDVVPTAGQPGASASQRMLAELVRRSVRAVAERRLLSGSMSFDDVLTQVRDALDGPGSQSAVDSLRSRFKLVLIDEFQDTDSVQWDIFSTLFGRPDTGTALVLVGDPKQAIYGFRGADVHTYLAAIGDGSRSERTSLATNWRSDAELLAALGVLFDGATFGSDIPFVPVEAAPTNRRRRIRWVGGDPVPAIDLRLATGGGIGRYKRNDQVVRVRAADESIGADLALRVRMLLDDGQIADDAVDGGWRRVEPPDIAVLVGRHDEATAIQSVLAGQGVPAVVARGGNVLQSPAAEQIRWLLHALGRPSDPRRARTYALSWFAGLSAAEVASLEDERLAALQEQLQRWSERLATHPVAEVLAQVWSESGVVERVLPTADGDRNMTDLDHVAELLQGAATTGRSGVAGLLATLDSDPGKEEDTEGEDDVAARRIASEAEAVQIMTVWTAKGLQFPVVCLPTLWHPPSPAESVIYVDPTTGRRTFDLAQGKDWPDDAASAARAALAFDEATGERLRLLYVALTRAQHQTMVWWARTERSDVTALARVLFARLDGVIDPEAYGAASVDVPGDDKIEAWLDPLVEGSAGALTVTVVDAPGPAASRWSRPAPEGPAPTLSLAPLAVVPDRSAHRWSFSSMVERTAAPHADPSDPTLSDAGAGDERDDQAVRSDTGGDGRAADPIDDPADRPGRTPPHGALTALPAGTAFGTLVHSILEEVDFASDDLDAQIEASLARQLQWRPMDLSPMGVVAGGPADGHRLLVEGLTAAIGTPLGPIAPGACLADVTADNRLNEVSFDLRLADGTSAAAIPDLGSAVLRHLTPSDPLHGWAAGLASGAIDLPLAGHLTGSIDLIFRTTDRAGRQRYVVADYKTNALHRRGQPATADDYGPARMAEAMAEHDYPLQAMLYSVALHRYLRWRLRDYRPETHLGGIAYLFVRGMAGPGAAGDGNPGVFGWSLPPGLVAELSDLLDGRRAGGSRT